jgi:membrane protease YdiL (CAAX protease family)
MNKKGTWRPPIVKFLGCISLFRRRPALTAAYLITKNLWASYIAHVANDWSLFTFILLFGSRG